MKTNVTWAYTRTAGGMLTEQTDGARWWFTYAEGDSTRTVECYSIEPKRKEERHLYLGYSLDEVIDAGKDLLGLALLAKGEPTYDDVLRVLPEITEKAYCFIGAPASHASLIVDTLGQVFPQRSGRDRRPAPLFTPDTVDPALTNLSPRQLMLGGEYPLLLNIFDLGDRITELLYFVEPGDSDRDPILWVRTKRYAKCSPAACTYDYRVSTFSRELTDEEMRATPLDRAVFEEALADTLAYWIKFAEAAIILSLPEKRLERVARGAMAAAATTCTADRPHYGHKFYGKELHDNFPPNYIWLIEAACLMGRAAWAKRVFAYMLNYALTDEGKFCYRQGEYLQMGSSAAEYGCLLFLANRYQKQLGIDPLDKESAQKLCGMGNVILANTHSCEEFEGRVLVKMCAEADTNSRVFVYLNNNLWAVRGLSALAALLKQNGIDAYKTYDDMAQLLLRNVNAVLKKSSIHDPCCGKIPPFRLDYTEPPHTLSNCKQTRRPLDDAERAEYFAATASRCGAKTTGQDITENNYANYRYYPEALSAMLLPRELADGAEALREQFGGELLGMTRFRSWVDNWPVLHHARFLIETGRIDKYLLLLYAHTVHHGNPELLCYYEQIKPYGAVSAPDCLPSLLTTPIMTGWIFAYERMQDGVLTLLSALPKSWYGKPFTAKGIGYSGGTVDLVSDGDSLTISFSSLSPEGCELVWRTKRDLCREDIVEGSEYIEKIACDRLILKGSLRHIKLKIVT